MYPTKLSTLFLLAVLSCAYATEISFGSASISSFSLNGDATITITEENAGSFLNLDGNTNLIARPPGNRNIALGNGAESMTVTGTVFYDAKVSVNVPNFYSTATYAGNVSSESLFSFDGVDNNYVFNGAAFTGFYNFTGSDSTWNGVSTNEGSAWHYGGSHSYSSFIGEEWNIWGSNGATINFDGECNDCSFYLEQGNYVISGSFNRTQWTLVSGATVTVKSSELWDNNFNGDADFTLTFTEDHTGVLGISTSDSENTGKIGTIRALGSLSLQVFNFVQGHVTIDGDLEVGRMVVDPISGEWRGQSLSAKSIQIGAFQ